MGGGLNHGTPESAHFDRAVGAVLRRARQEEGLSLQDVARRTGGRFKTSTVAGYERGERSISLQRFAALAGFYHRLPDQLLGEALEDLYPEVRRRIAIDQSRLGLVEQPAREVLGRLLRRVREDRGAPESAIVTIRSGDLRVAILGSGEDPGVVLRKLRPAMIGDGD